MSGTVPKSEADLALHIKKATNADETAPKRKHVRACIVYTWDHRSSKAFWNSMKLQPLHNDDIQLFKGLITIHKVLQEGHPSALREAQNHLSWLSSLGRNNAGMGGGSHGYTKLINDYVGLLLKKLEFHKYHPDFNGTFDYEEYISLKNIDDPNEGYEVIIDLLNLQDTIDDFQRLVFASISHGRSNECKISSLTPMVAESYGIYRFLTSMLRALHQTTNDDGALEPLRSRYYSQHRRLLNFYYDCSTLKYLTGLIVIPQLTEEPPNLFSESDEAGPELPKRPGSISSSSAAVTAAPSSAGASTVNFNEPQPTGDWWNGSTAETQALENQQRALEAQRQAELLRQQQLAMQQQQQFEEQQRMQEEQQRAAQDALIRDQMQRQAEGRVAELERDILNLRGQYDQNQLMLEQYDRRVKALESELAQLGSNTQLQVQSKNDLIQSLQEQVSMWKSKYESLAKLYSQLRQEHLDTLNKFKQIQAKAASAQEAIDKRERLERDLKAKNLELADLIKERDRARYDLDKSRGGQKADIEKLERDLRIYQDKLNDAERAKGADLSLLISKHNRELSELEEALKAKQRVLDDYESRNISLGDSELLRQKEEENEILQETINSMENALKEFALERGSSGQFASALDTILKTGAEQIQASLFDFESPMQAGNQNSTANYLLSIIEKTSSTATDFSTAFNAFIVDPDNGDSSQIIKSVMEFSNSIGELLINSKGVTRLAPNDGIVDAISDNARDAAFLASSFFISLTSEMIGGLEAEEVTELVISQNLEVQKALQALSDVAEKMVPKSGVVNGKSGDLGNLVDEELAKVANAISDATQKLTELLAKPKDPKFSAFDVQVNEAILAAAIAVTSAVAALIRSATECQKEIVAEGRGSSSKTAFYKKHNRWTEGLISAARAVGGSTTILIETADGVLGGQHTPEELIVASNEVAASTAQLVAASRVKASFMSKTQEKLETASRSVTSACRGLVNKVKEILASRNTKEEQAIDYSKLNPHEYKTTSMEQQVEVLRLEQALTSARNKLFEIRKYDYTNDDDDD